MRQFTFHSVGKLSARKRFGGIAGPVVFVLAAAAVLSVFYFASLSKGSREVFEESMEISPDPAEAERLLAESRAAESQFNNIHEFKKDQTSDADIDIYEKAVEAYGKHLAYAGMSASYNPRYEQMRKQLHNLRADILRRRSAQIEIQAEELATQKKYEEAEKLFADAAALENRITREFPLASNKNHARANFLENRSKTMRTIPLQIRAQQLAQQGEAALDAAQWPTANSCFSEALAIEKDLWVNYRNVIVSNSARIQRLQSLIATVYSAPDYERRERAAAEAAEAEQKGDWTAAAEAWKTALSIQKTIIQNFPRSLYADETTAQDIEKRLADAQARPQFIELEKEYAEMRANIRSRELTRVPLLAKQILRRAENILRECPKSTLISDAFLEELRFMDFKAADISSVQDSFFSLLRPIPGAAAGTQMLKTEVSQSLYTYIMPFNPSARKKLTQPAESVDFSDAQEFCRRISLLIGRPVRLPTQSEFLAAAGKPDPEKLLSQAWLLENSSGEVHDCGARADNENGFSDLYGNVCEWVSADPETAGKLNKQETFVAGGDCQTPVYSFPDEFFKISGHAEKSRTRGFRVVVEME